MNTASAFLVHTPFQGFIAALMLDSLAEFQEHPCHLLEDLDHPLEILDTDRWKSALRVSPTIGIDFVHGDGRRSHEVAKQFLQDLEPYDRVELFLSNADHPLANVLLRASRQSGGRIRLNSFPEGVGNIVVTRPLFRKTARNIAKVVYGIVTGSPFTWYGSDIAMTDESTRIFSFFPKELHRIPEKVHEIPIQKALEKRGFPTPERATLVLGQDHRRYLSDETQRELVAGVIRTVEEIGNDIRRYKPHHREAPDIAEWYREAGFEITPSPRPVELDFLEHPVSHVISYQSSALLHLKLFFGDAVESISYRGFDAMFCFTDRPERFAEARALYERYGVRMID